MSTESQRKRSPYIRVKVECPLCGKPTNQRYIKSKFYQPVTIEEDHHVLTYNWVEEDCSHIRPENYYIWHCQNCHFCDENDVFRGKIDKLWQGKMDFIRDKIIAAGRDPQCFISKVGNTLDDDSADIPNEMALMYHLSACYIQESFLTTNNRLSHKLSRFFLRLAWLFRERENLGLDSGFVPDGYLSFTEYLNALKATWPEMPVNENEALAKAIEYYVDLLNLAGKEDDTKKEITLMFLLQNLQLRIGELDNSYQYVRSIFTLAMKTRQTVKSTLDKGISSGDLDQQRIEQMKGLITWLSNSIEQASAAGDDINEQIFWNEYDKARDIAMSTKPMLQKTVVEKLREAGMHEITCRKVANFCRPPKGKKVAPPLPTMEQLRAKVNKSAPASKEVQEAEDDGEKDSAES